jgi:hypothetical protein
MPITLPTTFRSDVVIPYAPNTPDDRGHTWDWPGHLETLPSGATIASTTSQSQGNETITLGYIGLTRSEVRTLEAFVEARTARKDGFWCPTFQHDFYPYGVNTLGGNFVTRDWGFLENIYPLTIPHAAAFGGVYHWPYFVAFHRGGSWFLTNLAAGHDTGTTDPTGAALVAYGLAFNPGDIAGDSAVVSSVVGLAAMRLLWVRFADDAMATEWTHPRFASVTLRVQHLRLETPGKEES